jgi:hypothetical protein
VSARDLARVALLVASVLAPMGQAQVTQRVSLSSNGNEGSEWALSFASWGVIPDGRFVPFFSDAVLFSADTNHARDVFIRDRRTGATERVSVDSNGVQGNGRSNDAWCSADGRYVSFRSEASNLAPGDTNGEWDCFVHDRELGTTERVSVDSNGVQANADSSFCPITPDGRYVAFGSFASNLVPGDTNSKGDVFLRDRQTGLTERVSIGVNGVQGNNDSSFPFVSDDGRFVSFHSRASNLVPGDTNGATDAYVRDRLTGTTVRVNVSSNGAQSNPSNDDYGLACMISGDGRYVVIRSDAGNLVPGDTNGRGDVFVRDLIAGTTERVSVTSSGGQGNDDSNTASISRDGRFVAFHSDATNLVPGVAISGYCYVRDRLSGTTELASVDSHGAAANSFSLDTTASISSDGRFVIFDSWASNLVPGDTNSASDVFIRDRFGAPDFASICDPGASGVIGCPCGNPPAQPGRGCDNSASTGGAVLRASGGSFLSSDSLLFTTEGERASVLSVLLQGNGFVPAGAILGQGVRCVGGTIVRRLFTKTAVGGSLSVPDSDAGDPTVSARSSAKGDPVLAGESRWYLVYYRDPLVLGSCPVASTFNCTQTGIVTWSP